MATVSLILRQEYKSQDDKYPVTFDIRNQGTHAYILSGVKIEKKFWDKAKWIKKRLDRLLDYCLPKEHKELVSLLEQIYTWEGLEGNLLHINNFLFHAAHTLQKIKKSNGLVFDNT